MAVNPKTPGVYIDEISVLPASIAGVSTAIPAFIGYVEKAEQNGAGIPLNTPVRITSLIEYESIFGMGESQSFSVDIDKIVTTGETNISVTKNTESTFKLYYNMQMYFANGGGPCYIVPVGLYYNGSAVTVSKTLLITGLNAVAKVDEPTLLVFPDAASLVVADSKDVYDAALAQCQKLKDRFTLMDVKVNTTPAADATEFRTNGISADNLKYGAAYYPNLNTGLGYTLNENLINIRTQKQNGVDYVSSVRDIDLLNKIELTLLRAEQGLKNAKIQIASGASANLATFVTAISTSINAVKTVYSPAPSPPPPVVEASIITAISASVDGIIAVVGGSFNTANTAYVTGPITPALINALLSAYTSLIASIIATRKLAYDAVNAIGGYVIGSLVNVKAVNPSIYSTIMASLTGYTLQLNPSGAMAGIYARVDNERGVWKAPANVGVRSITGPSVNVTSAEQEGLNIDATSGKSINVIRSFTGRGTLVWGARTLAGNDNEWRYINVRRFYIFVEESIQEATEFVVFEPNTANTWVRVKGMIEAFLTGLWRDGALAGSTTKDAFFVNVGLGVTMTADDILNGKMIVEVGMAAVRPAEFIILKFEHKLQES